MSESTLTNELVLPTEFLNQYIDIYHFKVKDQHIDLYYTRLYKFFNCRSLTTAQANDCSGSQRVRVFVVQKGLLGLQTDRRDPAATGVRLESGYRLIQVQCLLPHQFGI